MEVEDLLEQIDILEYISQFCDFEEKGGEHWALSPFKDENTPSFSVRTETQKFYDFSSGIGGNVITFIKKYNNCGFPEAINILKQYAGVTEETISAPKRLETSKIAKKFKRNTPVVKENKTIILSPNYMERYEKDLEKLQVWADEGITFESMEKFGVRYDSFSDRLVVPIKDYSGNIINVCGRTLDPDYKSKKIRKYTYFKPLGVLDTLFGFSDNHQAILDEKEIILFEGSKSVMLADGWGINNTAAVLTSHLNPQQFLFLIQLGVRVVFAFDEDINIKDDIQIQRLKRYVTVEYILDTNKVLGEKMSPTDKGEDVFIDLYNERRQLL